MLKSGLVGLLDGVDDDIDVRSLSFTWDRLLGLQITDKRKEEKATWSDWLIEH